MKIVAQGGAKGLAPENTIAAIKKGLQHGADEIQFDVRVTKDNMVVLHKHAAMIDASGQKMVIADNSLDNLLLHKPDLARLDDALAVINHQAGALIEVHSHTNLKPIIASIDRFLAGTGKPQEVFLASFNQKTLAELHAALPQIQKVVNESWSGVQARTRAKALGTNRVSMNQLWLWRGFITPVTRRGWQLYAYTLNNPKKARRWAGYGLSGIITDYPDRFEK